MKTTVFHKYCKQWDARKSPDVALFPRKPEKNKTDIYFIKRKIQRDNN